MGINKSIQQARLRVNRTASLSLTTSWQDLVFNGTSQVNTNTFGKDPVSGNNMVWYDSANNLFRFYELYDQNYQVTLYLKINATILTSGMTVQYRLAVPNGGGAGIDTYFPFPDTDGFADATYINRIGNMNNACVPIPMYLSGAIKTNGIRVQLRLSTNIIGVGTVSVSHAIALIQQ